MCSSLNDKLYSSKALECEEHGPNHQVSILVAQQNHWGRLFKLPKLRHCKNQIDQNICRGETRHCIWLELLGDSKCSQGCDQWQMLSFCTSITWELVPLRMHSFHVSPTDWIRTAFAQYPPGIHLQVKFVKLTASKSLGQYHLADESPSRASQSCVASVGPHGGCPS